MNEEESKHAIRVLRLQIGDHIQLIDGKGGLFIAEISHTHPKRCELKVIDQLEHSSQKDHYIHLAVAPTKNMDRFEFFVEKATELGIDEITPIICERSERKTIKKERLVKISIAAAKQSVKPTLPVINELTSIPELLKSTNNGFKFVAHCATDENKFSLKETYRPANDVIILIGPEGDFTEKEINMVSENGFESISLGKSRLRTETAAIVACHAINFMNE